MWIKKVFQSKRRSQKDFNQILNLMNKYDVKSQSIEYVNKIGTKSKKNLKIFNNRSSVLMEDLIDTSINREN